MRLNSALDVASPGGSRLGILTGRYSLAGRNAETRRCILDPFGVQLARPAAAGHFQGSVNERTYRATSGNARRDDG